MAVNTFTLEGHLTHDPRLSITRDGAAVTTLRIGYNERQFDRTTNEWKDGQQLFINANVWREPGENAAETFRKGDPVTVTGKLRMRQYDDKEGKRVTTYEIEADLVAVPLRKNTAELKPSVKTAALEPASATAPAAPAAAGSGGFAADPYAADPI